MSKLVTKEINKCKECYHLSETCPWPTGYRAYCTHPDLEYVNKDGFKDHPYIETKKVRKGIIPRNCPLPDKNNYANV